jgi:hypothetical protein
MGGATRDAVLAIVSQVTCKVKKSTTTVQIRLNDDGRPDHM